MTEAVAGGLRGGDRRYVLDHQVGFVLRQVSQRHAAIFAEVIDESLTPTQFSALVKLCELDAVTQNRLGRGPSYLDPGSGGPENEFTNRNTTFMTWNLMHLARMLKDAGGIPAHGNQRAEWDAGCRFDFANPDYR